jgi:hypothetical protein
MRPLISNKYKQIIKATCPFEKRRCFSDSGVCGYVGFYAECPLTLKDRILTEVKEGGYEGVTPYDLFRAVRKNE